MSSCLILQDKNDFYIGADTACSVKVGEKYYRYSDNVNKIFIHGEDVYFCSGNLAVVNYVNTLIATIFREQSSINVEELSKLLRIYWPYLNKDVFDVEVMICRRNNNISTIYQLSQYNNYDPIIYKPRDSGINILCCGYKTKEVYNISKQMLLCGCNNVKALYKSVFNNIYDNKIGGNIIVYHNGSLIMNHNIDERGIEYSTHIGTLHLLIAEAVLSGYVESSTMVGGTIQIGEQPDGTYAFEVHEDGSVTMNGGSTISGYAKEEDIDELKSTVTIISDAQPSSANEGQLWLNTSTNPYTLMVFNNGEWVYFDQQDGGKIYTSQPDTYLEGDIWILADGEIYGEYGPGSILKADENLNWIDAVPDITTTIENVKESFIWDNNGIKVMKRVTDSNGNVTNPFYVHIDSTRMGFHSVEYNSDGSVKDDVEVVHIGNNSSVIQNATFQGSEGTNFENVVSFEQQINMYKSGTTTGFSWKVEENGSFSLAIIS